MMDMYVDYSSLTKPPVMWDRVHYGSSIKKSNGKFLVADHSSKSDAGWVGIYSDGASALLVNKRKRAIPAYKLSSGSICPRVELPRLKSSIDFIYCNDDASLLDPAMSRVALRGVIDSVEDLADADDYLSLDALLGMVDPRRLRPITAVAFLRSSFAVKERLRNWNGLYQVVYAHLSNSGQNPDRALRGLSGPRMDQFA